MSAARIAASFRVSPYVAAGRIFAVPGRCWEGGCPAHPAFHARLKVTAVRAVLGSRGPCRRVRTLLYEAANVMLTRYKGQLKLKDWAFAIAKRSTMRKARVALARRLAIIMHAMLRDGTEFASV